MSILQKLKEAATLTDVAALLGIKPSALSFVLYKKGDAANYIKFDIKKRYGGTRPISAPTDALKLVQRRLANALQDCMDEIAAKNGMKYSIAHGFKRRRSIVTNAGAHLRRRNVLNVDLKDFFGTINFGRVRGFFIKDRDFGLNEKVATVLAQIACFENALPQGSPCSPVISNLIGHVLDIHLVRLAAKEGCRYTRYADDLTFSTNAESFPERVAKQAMGAPHVWLPGNELERLVRTSGFLINPTKTRLQYCYSRQDVTGLVVNRKLNAPLEYRATVRAMVHRLYKTGGFEFIRQVPDGKGGTSEERTPGKPIQLRGMLNFVEEIDKHDRAIRQKFRPDMLQKKATARERTYRDFLFFTELYATQRPLLIGEGSTDYVYLLHAIRSRAGVFPALATVRPDGKIELKPRIYRYAGASTDRILGIKGGSAQLGNLIREYHFEKKKFTAPGLSNPVILVIDNDSGAAPIFGQIKAITGSAPSNTADFIHVTGNLYVVPTPLGAGGSQSQMEDFFDAKVKSKVLNGKTFDDSNNTDSETKYGKAHFAHKVVKPDADAIDFSGFDPLLQRIALVFDEHAKKVAASIAVGTAPPPPLTPSAG